MKLLFAIAAIITGGLLYCAYQNQQENLVFTAGVVVAMTLFIYHFDKIEERNSRSS